MQPADHRASCCSSPRASAAFVYFYEIQGQGARQDAEQRAKRLFQGLEAADVAWIALRTSDGAEARLEQKDGRWRLIAPLAFPRRPGRAAHGGDARRR